MTIYYLGDLFGPLLLTCLLSLTLNNNSDEKGIIFILVFFIFWFGGIGISLNSQLLGAKM